MRSGTRPHPHGQSGDRQAVSVLRVKDMKAPRSDVMQQAQDKRPRSGTRASFNGAEWTANTALTSRPR